jgi:RHS repeat-associated protein
VAPKEIDYKLDVIGDVTGRSAYNFIGVGPRYDIATEAISYNPLGLLTGISMTSHTGQVNLDNLTYTYDTLARVSTFGSIDGTATYGYDPTSQLTSANYTAAAGHTEPPNLLLAFDKNGNKTSINGASTTVGGDNHLTNDGTFGFFYDQAGNLIIRTRISTAPANDYRTTYTWDYRNRLTDVEFFNNNGIHTQHVHYVYDVWDDLIERDLDPNGSGTYTQIVHYVWDGDNVVLAFNGSGQLTARYLNGPNTSAYDQYYTPLVEEDVTSLTSAGTLSFDLQDAQGSVTDVADENGNLANHIIYAATGGVFSESNPSVLHIASFQGGYLDAVTGLEKFGARWEYMADAFWASQDPLGFGGGDWNLSRAVANDATNLNDPSGEEGDPIEGNSAELNMPIGQYGKLPGSRLSNEQLDFASRGGCFALALIRLNLWSPSGFVKGRPQTMPDVVLFKNYDDALAYYNQLQKDGKDPVMFAYQNTGNFRPGTRGFKGTVPGQIDPATLPWDEDGEFNYATLQFNGNQPYWEWMDRGRGGNVKHSPEHPTMLRDPRPGERPENVPKFKTVYGVMPRPTLPAAPPPPSLWAKACRAADDYFKELKRYEYSSLFYWGDISDTAGGVGATGMIPRKPRNKAGQ